MPVVLDTTAAVPAVDAVIATKDPPVPFNLKSSTNVFVVDDVNIIDNEGAT